MTGLARSGVADKTLVLLSGGLDSTAALHWALDERYAVRALGFRYGQPHADQELHAAGVIAARLHVPFSTALLVELPRLDPTPGLRRPGVSNAFVPGRNLLFLARAAAEAATVWPGKRVRLVVGFNRNDAAGFPDCRANFLAAAACALSEAFAGVIELGVDAPWIAFAKREILEWARRRPLALLADVLAMVELPAGQRPDFVVLPDVVAGGLASLALSRAWLARIGRLGLRWALAVQDGMTPRHIPWKAPFDVLFVGGSTPWKLETTRQWAEAAHARGKRCHVGRMGSGVRVAWAKSCGVDSIDSALPLFSAEMLARFRGAMAAPAQEGFAWAPPPRVRPLRGGAAR